MASFGPLQSAGGVASSNFEFTHLSIHATHTSKNSLREPQHSVSAPAHSFVIEPIPATSPQNGASSPDVVLVEKSFGSIHTKNKELEIEIIEAQKDSNRVANDKKCPSLRMVIYD